MCRSLPSLDTMPRAGFLPSSRCRWRRRQRFPPLDTTAAHVEPPPPFLHQVQQGRKARCLPSFSVSLPGLARDPGRPAPSPFFFFLVLCWPRPRISISGEHGRFLSELPESDRASLAGSCLRISNRLPPFSLRASKSGKRCLRWLSNPAERQERQRCRGFSRSSSLIDEIGGSLSPSFLAPTRTWSPSGSLLRCFERATIIPYRLELSDERPWPRASLLRFPSNDQSAP